MAYYDASSKNYHIISRAKKPRKPEVEGNTITYSNILPGVDVRLSYQATLLKEEILLTPKARENLPDPSTLGMKGGDVYLVFLTQFSADTSLAVYADQRKISERGRGRGGAGELMFDFEGEEKIDFKSLDGELKYFLPVDFAFMEESSEKADEANRRRIKRRFLSTEQGNFILAGVPLHWFQNQPPGTIVFDPSVNLYANEGDAFVYSYYPNANCGSSTNLYFGSYASNKVYRSLLKFDVSFVPEEAKISSAYLKLQL